MNIFYLDKDLTKCVQSYFDSHVVKMPIEYAQMLSTIVRELCSYSENITNPETGEVHTLTKVSTDIVEYNFKTHKFELVQQIVYKPTHRNHPCTKWVRESSAHFIWLQELANCLAEEFKFRYGKYHKSSLISKQLIVPTNFNSNSWLRDALQAMPEVYKHTDVITAYRQYYQSKEKAHLQKWKGRNKPEWWIDE